MFLWVIATVEMHFYDCKVQLIREERSLPSYVTAADVRRAKEQPGKMRWLNSEAGLGKQIGYLQVG